MAKLNALYEIQQQSNKKVIEILYVSSDKSKEEMENFQTKSHPWLAIPFENVEERNGLKKYFAICAAS